MLKLYCKILFANPSVQFKNRYKNTSFPTLLVPSRFLNWLCTKPTVLKILLTLTLLAVSFIYRLKERKSTSQSFETRSCHLAEAEGYIPSPSPPLLVDEALKAGLADVDSAIAYIRKNQESIAKSERKLYIIFSRKDYVTYYVTYWFFLIYCST